MTERNEIIDLFEQVAAIMQASGMELDEQTMHYMQPLLNGSMGYQEHQDFLSLLMKGTRHD